MAHRWRGGWEGMKYPPIKQRSGGSTSKFFSIISVLEGKVFYYVSKNLIIVTLQGSQWQWIPGIMRYIL